MDGWIEVTYLRDEKNILNRDCLHSSSVMHNIVFDAWNVWCFIDISSQNMGKKSFRGVLNTFASLRSCLIEFYLYNVRSIFISFGWNPSLFANFGCPSSREHCILFFMEMVLNAAALNIQELGLSSLVKQLVIQISFKQVLYPLWPEKHFWWNTCRHFQPLIHFVFYQSLLVWYQAFLWFSQQQ